MENKNHNKRSTVQRLAITLSMILVMVVATAEVRASNEATALASSLDELYEIVSNNKLADDEVNRQRIEEFERKLDEQQQLLKKENANVESLEQIGRDLNVAIAANEEQLTELEKQLGEALGNFNELFGVTRQVAGDTRAQVKNSLISVEFPNREAALEAIATTQKLPTLEQLRRLWSTLLQEQIQQGRVSRFETTITGIDGLPKPTRVTRLGPFTAFAEGRFLVNSESNQQLAFLQARPSSVFQHAAAQVSGADAGQLVNVAIDPSRGSILGLLPEIPSLMEQYHQGGLPGYLVTVLAVIGIAIGLQRIVSLWWLSLTVQRQIKSDDISERNPLGRVLKAYFQNPEVDIEALELKLQDAVLKEVPRLDRGLNTLKVLAAVAPLLGLLGTVLGMILTFQTITLWGASDVKLMADGISQALVTTVQGLVAAIPLLLLHSIANGRARVLQQILEEQSAGLIAAKAEAAHA